MTFLIGLVVGLLLSHWLEALLTRVVFKLPIPEALKAPIRASARRNGLDTGERGKVLKTDAYEASRELSEGDVLANLQNHDGDSQ